MKIKIQVMNTPKVSVDNEKSVDQHYYTRILINLNYYRV